MTGRLAGGALVLGAALWTALSALRQRRRETELLEQLSAALEDMASRIRWQRSTLPETIAAQRRYPLAGVYFRDVSALLTQDVPLRNAWHQAFAPLPVGGEVLAALELSGDEEKLTGSLLYAAARLKERCACRRAEQRQKAKLWLSGALCLAGLLVILLM